MKTGGNPGRRFGAWSRLAVGGVPDDGHTRAWAMRVDGLSGLKTHESSVSLSPLPSRTPKGGMD